MAERAGDVSVGPSACRHRGPAVSGADLARWETLSPGERRRWQLGAALHAEPDVLLLDELTNHLDLPTVERLEAALEALEAYPGAIVLVMHDDALAARCTRSVWSVRAGRVEVG